MNLGKGVQNQRWLNINALNLMWAAIGSQCKLMNRGVMCILFGSLKIILQQRFGLIVEV